MEDATPHDHSSVFDLFAVHCNENALPVCVQIQDEPLEDTGAPLSIIVWSKYIKHKLPPTQPTNIRLWSFIKQQLNITGVIGVVVKFKTKKKVLPLSVIEQCSVLIMDDNWIKEFNVFQYDSSTRN